MGWWSKGQWMKGGWLKGRRLMVWRRTPPRPPPPLLIERLAQPLDDMLKVLFQEATAGVLIVDRNGRIVRANDALRQMLGRHADVSPGQAATGIFAPRERDDVWEELRPALEGRRAPRAFATRLDNDGGDLDQTVDVSGVALREADGSVSGLILRLSDITVQRRLEAQLVQSQKLQAVGQLAGGIAHDFNNLLTAMLGAAEMVLERPGVELETRQDVDQIRRSAERGAALVRQLLAFGRQQTLQPKVIRINDAIQDLSMLLDRLLGGQVKLILDLETPGRLVRVDPTQLDQVLMNLAVNARDAMPDGGTLTLRSGHITLFRALNRGQETIPPGRYVMIEVQDTGVGISPDALPRIFDPFFTTRRELGGNGLGLSTVHGIVRQSDGFLAVDSQIGVGTRLRVYLPRYDGVEAVKIPRVPKREEPPGVAAVVEVARPRIALLVDDEDPVRRLAERALTKHGWQVYSALSAEAALEMLQEMERRGQGPKLSVLITDVVMPGIDGPTLVAEVRKSWPGLPAILASGYAEEVLARDLVADSMVFLPKPYTLRTLVGTAEEVVRQHESAEAAGALPAGALPAGAGKA
jgi:two-component system cell cycle sensor histidine kinase/response regulator CckA